MAAIKRLAAYQRNQSRGSGQVRIIAGQFSGHRLRVPTVPGLRPTPARARETLFNWLQGMLTGARVLDLFSGSGALAFEALSRGASEVVLIERHQAVIKTLRQAMARLAPDRTRVIAADALAWLRRNSDEPPFDLVFVDPPFSQGLTEQALSALEGTPLLNADAHVYVEWPHGTAQPFTAAHWEVLRNAHAGASSYALLTCTVSDASTTRA